MEILLTIILLGLGIFGLVKSAGWLVDGASRSAELLKVSPLIVGLSVVAIGTSLPELGVSLAGVLSGSGNISVGNVIGSNICNIGLVVGVAGIICTLSTSKSILQKDFPIMTGLMILLILLGINNKLERWEGVLLLSLFICYFIYLFYRHEPFISKEKRSHPMWIKKYPWIAVIIGILGIAMSAWITVKTGTKIARFIGITESIIGLSMIAVGTSLPELVTSCVAMVHRESDISLGNVMGSNIANIALVLGCVGTVRPITIEPRLFRIDGWIMLGYALILLPLLITKYKLSRREGYFLVGSYLVYVFYLYVR
jgi:cation:H+ antiporter